MQSQLLAGLGDRSDRPALLTAHCDRLFDQLAVAPRHPPLVEIEVVFKADADVAAEAELVWRPEHPDVDQWTCVAHVTAVEALHLGPNARLIHRLEKESDVRKGVGEDVVVIELLALFRVDGIVHRPHVQGRHIRLELPDVGNSLVRRDANGAGREVDYHVGAGADLRLDVREGLTRPGRRAIRISGVNVDDGRTGLGSPASLLSNLGRSVGDRGTVLAAGQCPRERSRYDDAMLAAHTGMFPCLRHGRSMRLSRACSRPLMTTFLVSEGSITSSIIAQPAAM